MLKRYSLLKKPNSITNDNIGAMVEDSSGQWIRYEDYQTAILSLVQRLKRLECNHCEGRGCFSCS